jgi:hypothetical protein
MSSPTHTTGILPLPDCHGHPTCDPAPVCPVCGGLECLCRPRFFAGQLLTEEDLNRLDHYILAKNRLHNRFLHGWGVACGLEVVCGHCHDQGTVLVKPGYALSPCGNDIVVCQATTVDICDLINRCRPPLDDCHDLFAQPTPTPPAQPHDPAQPPAVGGGIAGGRLPDCGGNEEWVLAICYAEKPSRGVAPLRMTLPEPGCGCGGGGSCRCDTKGKHGCGGGGSHARGKQCGCGCGGHGKGKKSPAPPARTLPEQCEPTVVCEGYRFVVYKRPPRKADELTFGAAQRRFICCMEPLFRELGNGPGAQNNPQQAQAWVIAFRDAVREFVLSEGLYDCRIAEKLAAVVIPAVNDTPAAAALAALNQAALSIADIAGIALQKCFCAAFLPPCPEPAQNDCVPLATVTVSRGQCRVLKVCNLSARRFLVTWPNIGYWLSFVFSENPLRQELEKFCCEFDPVDGQAQDVNFFAGRMRVRAGRGEAHEGPAAFPQASLFWQSVAASRNVIAEHLLLGALNARDAQGQPFATDEELAHPTEFLLFNDVLAPLIRGLVPATFGGVVGGTGPGGDRVDDLAREISDLRSTIDQQKKAMDRQQKAIDELKRKR